jgi:hypothetical protein
VHWVWIGVDVSFPSVLIALQLIAQVLLNC